MPVFFDIATFSDPDSAIPYTLLKDEKRISDLLGKLGIRNDHKIIIYDNSDLHSSARALWMFKVFGHNPHLLYVLDGGLKAWEKYGGKMEAGLSPLTAKTYEARLQTEGLRTLADMKANLRKPTAQLIDLRHPVRYAGGPESRHNVRSGHIPGSFCLPYMTLFDKNEGTFLPLEKIRKKFHELGVTFNAPIITMCGSGITAASLNFLLDLMGHANHGLYDGSWSEWGSNQLFADEKDLNERPIATCIDNGF